MRGLKHSLTAGLMALALLGALVPPAAAAPAANEDTDQDRNFIKVQKIFEGISDVEALPDSLSIVLEGVDGIPSYTLGKFSTGDIVWESGGSDAYGNLMWQWTIYGAPAGTYYVSESGADIPNYSLHMPELGPINTEEHLLEGQIDTTPFGALQGSKEKYFEVPPNSHLLFTEISVQGKSSWFIWTEVPLSENQRIAFITALKKYASAKGKDDKYIANIDTADKYFFSGDTIESAEGLMFNGKLIRYELATNRVYCDASFNDGNTLNGVGNFIYGDGEAEISNAEIEIINTYTPVAIPVTVIKTVAGTAGDINQVFHFIASYQDGATEEFDLSHGESYELTKVFFGQPVTITETDASDYRLSVIPTGTDENTVDLDIDYPDASNYACTFTSNSTDPFSLNFVNKLDAPPDMGITLDALPYALILLGAGAAASVLVLRKRRRGGDDGEEW